MKAIFKLVICYLSLCGVSFLYAQQKAPGGAKKMKLSAVSTQGASLQNGKKVYMQYCLSCHQADGAGVQRLNPPLIKTSYVLGDKNKLISILQNGFNEEVEIDGETYSNNMPAFNYLKDQEIADVLTYIRNSFGNTASSVTVKEVAAIRPKVKK